MKPKEVKFSAKSTASFRLEATIQPPWLPLKIALYQQDAMLEGASVLICLLGGFLEINCMTN